MKQHLDLLIKRYPGLQPIKQDILDAYLILENCYTHHHKLLVAGNGGSAADAGHIVGELMKGFLLQRKISSSFAKKLQAVDSELSAPLIENLQQGLKAISLAEHSELSTAYLNDMDGSGVFAQQVFGYGDEDDVFLGISTSGNSHNVLQAAVVAKALGMKIIGLTGRNGGKLAQIADVTIQVPETETFMVQELHLPIYHCLCAMLEEKFFGK